MRDGELRVGASLRSRFVVSMTLSLTVVLFIAGFVLYGAAARIAVQGRDDALSQAALLGLEPLAFEAIGRTAVEHPSGVRIFPVRYGMPPREGTLYQAKRVDRATGDERTSNVVVPVGRPLGRQVLGLIFGLLLVVLVVGAGVALWVAGQVVRPINDLVDDVRLIAKGDLAHRTRARGGGELQLLARAIDRMTHDLAEAQEAKVELSIRHRELDLAASVRESLLPLATPLVEGYDVGASFLGSAQFGGDFHDFVELPDGRVGLLVCDVSGQGVPSALVGATARSYLRSELNRGSDLAESFRRVNRWLVADVRRGMYVTALYALLDPPRGTARVLCAGHKLPLLRWSAADKKLRAIHPDGIALGFDKGPVFDGRLQVQETPLEPGDRLVLLNSAPAKIANAEGQELGEKALFGRIARHAEQETTAFLRALKRDLEHFAGEAGIPFDVSLVTVSRGV